MRSFVVLFFSLALAVFGANGQSKKDSSFLLREFLGDASYHVVYISHNNNAAFYKKIRSLTVDKERYRDVIAELKAGVRAPLAKHPVKNLPHKWFPLWLYKNKYYLYDGSEDGIDNWVKITDTVLILGYSYEGAFPTLIRSIKKQNPITTEFSLANTFADKSVYIHLVNPAKGIAVFEYPDQPIDHRYRLMVNLDNIEQYPVIVNYCKENKTNEWDFDTPDFKKLLQLRQK